MTPDLFLSPLISVAGKKVADSLIKQICSVIGLEDDREKLEIKLLLIQKTIADAEKQGANDELVKKFLEKLHAAATEAVNVLDDFQYEGLRQNAISQQRRPSIKVIMNFFTNENPVIIRCKMSNKLAKTLMNIDGIATEMYKFNFAPCDPEPSIDRETQSFVLDSEIIGRERERDEIMNVLLDPQRERDNLSVLTIVGMAGLGKTTLAQMVYNHEKVQKHFNMLLWVCVSINFVVIDVIKSLIKVAQKGGVISESRKEVLQQKLREILSSKRYLLVLDDVWNEEIEKWDELKSFLFSGASSGSVIIVTTRNKEVASIMKTLPSYDLASLTEEDSWRLFEKRAFHAGSPNPTEDLIAIAKTIVRKCVGAPLVVKAMGGLMGTKKKESEWRAISENKILDSLQSTGNALPILKLSYDNLPSHVKQCFIFCAIFPQDFEIEKEELIQLWMANDFIPTYGTMNLEDSGRNIFNELHSRSFFQDVKEIQTMNGPIPIVTCKMHDLMHELATKIAGKTLYEWNNPLAIQKEVQHMHLLVPHRKLRSISSVMEQFPVIHTLLYNHHPYNHHPDVISKLEKSYILKSNFLRALQFWSEFPPKGLRYMRHVRYLDLSHGSFELLPKTITTLYNLQTLKLSRSKICKLPKGMRFMTNLRHLYLDDCDNLKCMPVGIGKLTSLQTLTTYVAADLSRGGSIRELSNLNLCGHLRLCGLESVRDRENARIVNLATKLNLCSVELAWSPKDINEKTSIDETVLEALAPHNNLKYLGICDYAGFNFPRWLMESLVTNNLKKLSLIGCINCAELPPVWQLPLLENLILKNMKRLIFIVPGTFRNADGSAPLEKFPSLNILTMKNLTNLEAWHEQESEVTFPKLAKLNISGCPKLKTIPLHAPLAELTVADSDNIKLHQISNLSMISILRLCAGEHRTETETFSPPNTIEEMFIQGFENFNPIENQRFQASSLRKLCIIRSNCFFSKGRIKSALEFWKHFECLKILEIYRCHNLIYWPYEEFRSLKCLETLWIVECSHFTGSLPVQSPTTSHADDFLRQLKMLVIYKCPELVEVPGSSSSIETLYIHVCLKLSCSGLSGLTNLTQLRTLAISDCPNLTALPDNMADLTSLESLDVTKCPGIKSFPNGLQGRLSSLQHLRIEECPALERHCRRGGDYWHWVLPIALKYFNYDPVSSWGLLELIQNYKRNSAAA